MYLQKTIDLMIVHCSMKYGFESSIEKQAHTQTHKVCIGSALVTDMKHNEQIRIIISMRFCAILGIINLITFYLRG